MLNIKQSSYWFDMIFKNIITKIHLRSEIKSYTLKLYQSTLHSATNPDFYEYFQLDDNFDTRLDVLAFHLFFLLEAIEQSKHVFGYDLSAKSLQRLVLERAVDDLEDALRRQGASDVTIGKKVQKLSQSFFGRLTACRLAMQEEDQLQALSDVMSRVLYHGKQNSLTLSMAQNLMVIRKLFAAFDAQQWHGDHFIYPTVEIPQSR